jgi:hypothetical protein
VLLLFSLSLFSLSFCEKISHLSFAPFDIYFQKKKREGLFVVVVVVVREEEEEYEEDFSVKERRNHER